ncbi:MAG TPA: putative Ig domain-containing protein, partial [Fimbriimonadaceae bacterium]|nr:putative Ig domain-containing protein [Fimbriimonadaceae bacterium]
MRGFVSSALACVLAGAAWGSQVIDGIADYQYNAPIVVQNVQTSYGDNLSELDVAYAYVKDGALYLVLAGNLENNGNKLNVFIDCKADGQNRLRGDNWMGLIGSSWYLTRLGNSGPPDGFKFESGFEADYYFGLNRSGGDLFVDYSETPDLADNVGYYLGKSNLTDGTLSGGTNLFGVKANYDGSNTAGAGGGTSTGYALGGTVATGIELCIPLAAIGNPSGAIKVCAFVGNNDNSSLSNHFLPGVGYNGGTVGSYGEPRGIDLGSGGSNTGTQYFYAPWAGNGHLIVYRMGTGSGALGNSATAAFLDEYDINGNLISTTPMPTTTSGSNRSHTNSGSAANEGQITVSSDSLYLLSAGYDAPVGTATIASSNSSTFNRVVGRVSRDKTVDTSTANIGFNTQGHRGASAFDGTKLWSVGSGEGIRVADFGTSTTALVSSTVANNRATQIFNNQLYLSTSSGTTRGVYSVGIGMPISTGTTSTSFVNMGGSAQPCAFYFADAHTLYVADDRTSSGAGGVYKFTWNGSTWNQVANLNTGISATTGIRGVCGIRNSSNQVVLYATSTAGHLLTMIDGVGGWTTLVSAPTNTAFRSVRMSIFAAPNSAPTLTVPSDATLDEGDTYSETAIATDPDAGQTLTFSKVSGPAGLTVSPSGAISWSTTEADGPGVYTVTIKVEDDGSPALSDTKSFQITVNEVNQAPVLDPVGNQSIDEGDLLTFTAAATDPDLPANGLTFSLAAGVDPVPAGASMTAGGAFTWTPSEAQGPGTYTFKVVVTDNGAPGLSDEEEITITVNEVNQAPVLDPVGNQSIDEGDLLTFTATASDDDDPANALTFSLAAGVDPVPAGASITAGGVFTWTPTEAQGPGTYTFKVVVTDDGTPSLSDEEEITITVDEVNQAPALVDPGTQNASEGVAFSLQLDGSDADLPAQGLTFAKVSGPAALTVSASGLVEWTPGETDGGTSPSVTVSLTDGTDTVQETFTISVAEVNAPPVWAAIPDQGASEHVLFTLDLSAFASDPNDIPANLLTYSLVSGPAGLTVSPLGLVSWTPGESDGGTSPTITVEVTDDGVPNLSVQTTFVIDVTEVNAAPVLDAIGNQTVDEGDLLTFTATATDPDLPANSLAFSLAAGVDPVPPGASITAGGVFTWTPTEAQGPGAYTFKVVVTDDGDPALSDEEEITITVNEVNLAPVLDAIGNKSVQALQTLSFTATASDPDLPANGLTFSLDAGAPAGAAITPTGDFTWTPTEAQAPGVYSITIRVTDDGDPALSDTETIQITVAEVPDEVTLELTIQHHYPLVAMGPVVRGLVIRLGGTGGPNAPLILDRDVTFDATGNATLVFTEADGLMVGADFSRISVKDPLHTLRATVTLTETGPDQYSATAVLRGGNLNKDNRVDIGDYVVFVLRFGSSVVPDTPFDVPGTPPT